MIRGPFTHGALVRATTEPFTAPFTLTQAQQAGLTRAQLRGPAYQRVMYGVYAPAGPLDLQLRIAAARLVLPDGAIATGRTALRLVGVDLGADLPLTFVIRQKIRVRHRGVDLVRVAELPEHHQGIALPEEACGFVLDAEPLLAAVTVVDHALNRRRITRERLLVTPLSPRARAAYAHVDDGAQSPRETRLRLALTHAGLPRPETQVRTDSDDGVVRQVDMLYAEHRVVIEYEGGQHLTDPGQWAKDIDRYAALVRMGYTVIRVTAARMRTPDLVVTEVFQALRVAGYRGPAPRFTASWWLTFG